MFIGDNQDSHQAATQKLMEAAVYLRRASDSLMAVQAMLQDQNLKTRITGFRVTLDKEAIFLDNLFQEAGPRYFG